jgi:predicted nucleotidyltransferase
MAEDEAIIKAKKFLFIVNGFLAVESAYLFGSRVSGAPRPDSDIDIGIFAHTAECEYFAVLKKLFAARRQVDALIEPHLFITGNDTSGFHDVVRAGTKLL